MTKERLELIHRDLDQLGCIPDYLDDIHEALKPLRDIADYLYHISSEIGMRKAGA